MTPQTPVVITRVPPPVARVIVLSGTVDDVGRWLLLVTHDLQDVCGGRCGLSVTSCFMYSMPSCPFSWCPLRHSYHGSSVVFELCNMSRPSMYSLLDNGNDVVYVWCRIVWREVQHDALHFDGYSIIVSLLLRPICPNRTCLQGIVACRWQVIMQW